MNLNFIVKSSDHLRYEDGVHVSGPHGGAKRAIKVEPNISGDEGVSVTTYNLDGNHPLWQNNIQMGTKPMKIISDNNDTIVLRGYGYPNHPITGGLFYEAPFSDYGLTIKYENNVVVECTLHMHDRGVDIKYLK